MTIEITKELFYSIVTGTTKSAGVQSFELFRKTFFITHGVKLFILDNHASGVTSYHVEDINS